MAKGLVDMVLDQIFDGNWVGRWGEKLTEWELNIVKLFGRKGKVLRNIYVPKDNGETSEIDVVFITQKGIFVIESKNYSGWIFGDEKSVYWTAMLPNKVKNKFYNPIKQNKTHIKWLGQYLNDDIPLFFLVVFSERCELKKVAVDSKEVYVIKRDALYAAVKHIWDNSADKLDDAKIESVYTRLQELTNADVAVKAAHIADIEKKYKKTVAVQEHEKETEIPIQDSVQKEELICPLCGNQLLLRTAKKGANAGNQFYGCCNFPKCRYIQNINAE